jgi:hypothetical protein
MATSPATPAPATPSTPDIGGQITAALKQLQAAPGIQINTDVGAVANCIAELAKLAQTPAGQAILNQWRSDAVSAEAWLTKTFAPVASWFQGLFK